LDEIATGQRKYFMVGKVSADDVAGCGLVDSYIEKVHHEGDRQQIRWFLIYLTTAMIVYKLAKERRP
jgi:hypothetical protein